MSHLHSHSHAGRHNGLHAAIEKRVPRPGPLPLHRIDGISTLQPASPVRRAESSSTSTCTGSDCKNESTMTTETLPIILGIAIPVICAILVLFFLHRRHLRRLRAEDADDRHKSLDFGMDFVTADKPKGKKGPPGQSNMVETEKSIRRGRGMSIDIGSPYLLPPGLHGSRESIHSLTRSMHGDDDKYRPATAFSPTDNMSMKSYPTKVSRTQDDASSFTASSNRFVPGGDDMQQNLLQNAQRMSRSSPPVVRESPIDTDLTFPGKPDPAHLDTRSKSPGDKVPLHLDLTAAGKDGIDTRHSNAYLGSFIDNRSSTLGDLPSSLSAASTLPGEAVTSRDSLPITSNSPPASQQPPPRLASLAASQQHPQAPRISLPSDDDRSDYGDARASTAMVPQVNVLPNTESHPDAAPSTPNRRDTLAVNMDNRRLTVMGVRPLPPEDPSDNPEQRANRIRSFYKEYFDENKQGAQEDIYDDYGTDYYDDGIVFDPTTGEYMTPNAPFAQPMTRRAMTPPPRAPPRFQGARHMATGSAGGGFMPPPGPRAYSSASGRFGPVGRPAPRKPAPPPSPLHILPTPSKLKDDSILPIDFAPAFGPQDRRVGRPETPQGGLRPYSPMLPAHSPLVSAFDDLAAMPSPHALRKSGTFTALDFAPPPRFKNADSGSDAGSIRSNGSGITRAQAFNVRNGAYRVSRLPAETVGTRDDFSTNLRPKWDMRG